MRWTASDATVLETVHHDSNLPANASANVAKCSISQNFALNSIKFNYKIFLSLLPLNLLEIGSDDLQI